MFFYLFLNLFIFYSHVNYGIYDFIIIEGGSAGSILTSRLSEVPEWSVLLLEAGDDKNAFSDIPGFSNSLGKTNMNWGYFTTPQATCCQGMDNHQCVQPRGKVLGGSSEINGLMYVRGSPSDYESWEKDFDVHGWSYKDVLPYFLKSEVVDFKNFDKGYHGSDGLIHVNYTAPPSSTAEYLVEAVHERGLKEIDYNGKSQLGVSRIQFNINFNKRSNGARAYLDPIRKGRSNLNITLNAFVTKILLRKSVAYGVEFVKGGQRYFKDGSRSFCRGIQ
ncbi:glucose dehydrogenase [FAD, quinone]-like [Leptinotarsa decemlineata]|uniref:glucose dehydrogenase [FAD, quinone]-like n=1 Tax=Leptinotarsa decemlineata TaxID=7539 RepID=UPI003D30670F